MKRGKLIGIMFICLLAFSIQAQTKKILEREYQESYSVNEDATLIVENKYGDVFLTSWDKNEIKIDAIVKIESWSNRSRATKIFDGIEVRITGSKDFVKAITSIPSFMIPPFCTV